MTKQLLDLNCTLIHETEKAVLVTTDVGGDTWVPKSLCEVEKKNPKAELPCDAIITISESLAISKGLV